MRKIVNGIETVLIGRDGKEINVGDVVRSRGKQMLKVVGGTPPHKASSEGFVEVEGGSRFYASVIGATWSPHPWR